MEQIIYEYREFTLGLTGDIKELNRLAKEGWRVVVSLESSALGWNGLLLERPIKS